LNWTKRGDYPKNIDEELKTYPLVTAKELRHRRDRPRQVQMLTREFIDGKSCIDCAHYTYFLTVFLVFGIRQFVQSPLWLLLQARDHLQPRGAI
jgi:transposase